MAYKRAAKRSLGSAMKKYDILVRFPDGWTLSGTHVASSAALAKRAYLAQKPQIPATRVKAVAQKHINPSKRLPPLTAHDKAIVRRTARSLRDGYDDGDEDSTMETVMLSSGYADVEIGFDSDDDYAFVVRHGVSTRVPMTAGPRYLTARDRRGQDGGRAWGLKAMAGRKTGTRKKVPSKKVANPRKRVRKAAPKRKANGQFAKKGRR